MSECRTWKKAAEKNHVKPRSGYPLTRPILGPVVTLVQVQDLCTYLLFLYLNTTAFGRVSFRTQSLVVCP